MSDRRVLGCRKGHRGNTFYGARYSILLVSGTPYQNYKIPATSTWISQRVLSPVQKIQNLERTL